LISEFEISTQNVTEQPLWETVWSLLKKLKIDLPYNPPIPLLGTYPKDCESAYNKGTCIPMFTAALFIIAKLWKQPRCPTTDEWIKKIWYLDTMEFYLATKNEILSLVGKWMELENIILSEVSQTRLAKTTCSLSYVKYSTNAVILLNTGTLRGGHTQEG
jgi:hypothetical protein